MNIRIAAIVAAIAMLLGGQALAQTSPKVKSIAPPKTVLYVGNSFFYFNDSMHRFVGGLIAQGDPQNRALYRSTSVTISGSGLNWHNV
jgi:hypothetical protein